MHSMKQIKIAKAGYIVLSAVLGVLGVLLLILLLLLAAAVFYRDSLYEIFQGIRQTRPSGIWISILLSMAAYVMEGMTIACMAGSVIPVLRSTQQNAPVTSFVGFSVKKGITIAFLCEFYRMITLGSGMCGDHRGHCCIYGAGAFRKDFRVGRHGFGVAVMEAALVDGKICEMEGADLFFEPGRKTIFGKEAKDVVCYFASMRENVDFLCHSCHSALWEGQSELGGEYPAYGNGLYAVRGHTSAFGGGALEFVFLLFFGGFVEEGMAMPAILLFRFATWVLPFAVGGVLLLACKKKGDVL